MTIIKLLSDRVSFLLTLVRLIIFLFSSTKNGRFVESFQHAFATDVRKNQSTRRMRMNGTPSSSTQQQLEQQQPLYGFGMDQKAMMEQDQLVAVDANDVIIPNNEISSLLYMSPSGSESAGEAAVPQQFLSKRLAHTFTMTQPRGVAHRAFSVFLFNGQNQLLLTKRASTKITFPDVWTNSCCSHPLYNQQLNEIDDAAVDFPSYPGIRYAALRKLRHELGITSIKHSDFVFLKKFHYWAADTITYGNINPQYGEHEIDYVLFTRYSDTKSPNKKIILEPNPEEVSDYKYVSKEELKSMFRDKDLIFSPWFEGIMKHGGFTWWENLDEIINQHDLSGTCTFASNDVEYFDPPADYFAVFNLPEHNKHTGVLSYKNKESAK